MRRYSVSIPSNIAEGSARASRRNFAHFITIARGSSAELQTQLILPLRLGYLSQEDYDGIESLCLSGAYAQQTLRINAC